MLIKNKLQINISFRLFGRYIGFCGVEEIVLGLELGNIDLVLSYQFLYFG